MARSSGEESAHRIRERIHVTGIVQGVGFRPYVYRLAQKNRITGYVRNRMGEVIIEAEGSAQNIQVFKHQLQFHTVKPIQIDSLESMSINVINDKQFMILPSEGDGQAIAVFPPDLAICSDCLHDLYNVQFRFFHYPFTSCTYCGPRFSVIRCLPYDREHTSFQDFPICEFCKAEYHDPSNRRFHAQTIACPKCGPFMEIMDSSEKKIPEADLTTCHAALRNGSILAVKGVGGFHLVCNAKLKQVIEKLRMRKRRPNKPFALMAKDLTVVKAYFEVSTTEMEALRSPVAPIVLLKPKRKAERELPLEIIAPGLTRIGIMLPYTPLHHLLFAEGMDCIVATSGNSSGYPTTYTNKDAFGHLRTIADLFVMHNREIVMWNDDSVGQVVDDEFQLIRRSRGYVPKALPIPLPRSESDNVTWPTVLGVGAEMKNTFCFIHNGQALISQHIGNIHTLENLEFYHNAQNHFMQLLNIKPHLTAYDPHPDYLISREVKKDSSERVIPVYHHHAHMAACMAENMIDIPVIGCILDGTGFGTDGTLWGFEILIGDYLHFDRVHHLKPLLLPGGDASIRNPWMMGLSLLHEAAGGDRQALEAWISERFPQYQENIPIVFSQFDGKLPSLSVSSAGRLFDGISSILNICTESTYEGEAAVRLSDIIEASVKPDDVIPTNEKYSYEMIDDQWNIVPMIRGIMHDLQNSIPVPTITYKFHHTLAEMMLEGVRKAHRESGITSVVFSGGVWNNRYLLSVTKELMIKDGYSVYTHKKVPTGDGGIAFGQAVCGLWRWAKEHVLIGADKSHGGICK